jgi:NAD-dependent dihydropyrimidine dehydrogenase PreA subunit
MAKVNLKNIPREKIPWYPRVDTSLCEGCQACINFCKNDVYRWDDENQHPIVLNPLNCVVGCEACAQLCPTSAISFPSMEEIAASIGEEAHSNSA